MNETPRISYDPVFREDLGDGVWLIGFRCLYRQTAMIGLEMAETHRFDTKAEYRRVIREKMQVLGDRLMESWDGARTEEDGQGQR